MTAARHTKSAPSFFADLPPAVARKVVVIDGVSQPPQSRVPADSILTIAQQDPVAVLSWYLDRDVRHVCQFDSGSIETEVPASAMMLAAPHLFLDFPVAAILAPQKITPERNAEVVKLHMPFSQAIEKDLAISRLRDLLSKVGRPETLIDEAVLVADEFFTNAVYNAPFIDPITGRNPGIDRGDQAVAMPDGKHAEFIVGFDDSRLVVACRDPFGSLRVRALIERIRDCCVRGVSASMRLEKGGAGIGAHMVFNTCASFYVGVNPGKTTVLAGVLQWKWNTRKRSSGTKNLHVFQL